MTVLNVNKVTDSEYRSLVDLVVEFAWRQDHRQNSSIHELMTDNGALHFHGDPIVGEKPLRTWGTARDNMPSRATCHVMSNFRFLRTDEVSIVGNCLQTVFLHDGPGVPPAAIRVVSEITDAFSLTPKGWRFSSRTLVDIFSSRPGAIEVKA